MLQRKKTGDILKPHVIRDELLKLSWSPLEGVKKYFKKFLKKVLTQYSGGASIVEHAKRMCEQQLEKF